MSLSHSAIWDLSIKILHKNLLHSLSISSPIKFVLLECEAYTNLRNELNSDIATLFCGQNVDADFTGLPPHGKIMFLIGDLGYHFSNFIGDEIDKLCKRFLCNIFFIIVCTYCTLRISTNLHTT
jgi:hypothetical protein